MQRTTLAAALSVVITTFLAASSSNAQERIEFSSFGWLAELDVSVSRFGEVRHRTSAVYAGEGDWVAVSGARYLVRARGGGLEVFDLRARRFAALISIPFSSPPRHIIADPLRPRVFVGDFDRIGVVDIITHTYRHLASTKILHDLAYAPKSDQLFLLEHVTIPDQSRVSILDVETGTFLRRFPTILRAWQILVGSDGERVYVRGIAGFPNIRAGVADYDAFIRAGVAVYDALTGQQSARIDIDADEILLDERRDWLFADVAGEGHLVVLHARTLGVLATKQISPPSPPNAPVRHSVKLLPGRWMTGIYLVRRIEHRVEPFIYACDSTTIEALDPDGTTRAAIGVAPCPVSAVVLVRSPFEPEALRADVAGSRVTLAWDEPGDASDYEIEVGFSPGTRALVQRVGLTNTVSADNVPPGVYYVRVRAVNEVGPSPPSNEVRVTVP